MKKFLSFAAFCILALSSILFTSCLKGGDELPDVYEDLAPGKAMVAYVNMTNDTRFQETELKAISEVINSLASDIKKTVFSTGDDLTAMCKSRMTNGIADLPLDVKVKLKRYECQILINGYYLSPDSKQLVFNYIYDSVKELSDVDITEGEK